MRTFLIIFEREIKAYFDSAIAYIFAIVFLMITCGIFINDFFLVSVAEMDSYFTPLPYLMILFLPAVSMRLWAEERKDNTYELLMTLPVKKIFIIMGKYASSVVFFLITLLGTLPVVIMLFVLGKPDPGKIFASYMGVFFLGALYLAIGIFLSGVTGDQIVAYLLSVFVLALYYASGNDMVASILDGLWPELQAGTFLRDVFSAVPHYQAFTRGIIDLHSILYFTTLVVFALWLNDVVLRRDKI